MEDIIVNIVNFVSSMLHLSPAILAGVFGVLLAVSEALASIGALKSNSILQLIINVAKKLAGK